MRERRRQRNSSTVDAPPARRAERVTQDLNTPDWPNTEATCDCRRRRNSRLPEVVEIRTIHQMPAAMAQRAGIISQLRPVGGAPLPMRGNNERQMVTAAIIGKTHLIPILNNLSEFGPISAGSLPTQRITLPLSTYMGSGLVQQHDLLPQDMQAPRPCDRVALPDGETKGQVVPVGSNTVIGKPEMRRNPRP